MERNDLVEEHLADLRRRQAASWPEGKPRSVEYFWGERPITDYLRHHATESPEDIAFIYYGREISFAEVNRFSDVVASYLLNHGVRTGDRVGVMLSNCPQFVFVFLGILKAGAVHVPINPMFKQAELEYELRDSGARVLFALTELRTLTDAVTDAGLVDRVVHVSAAEYLPVNPTLAVPAALASQPRELDPSWHEVLGTPVLTEWPTADLDALAALNYTGGTTGLPKGCEHTQRHMLYTAATTVAMRRTASVSPSARMTSLNFLPVFWIAGENAVISPIYSGSTLVLLNRWDPIAVMQAIEHYGVVAMGGTVDSYVELMDHPRFAEFDLTSLASPSASSFVTKLSIPIRQRWASAVGNHSVLQESSYGMTETHTMDCFLRGLEVDDLDLNARPVFCGLPVPGTDIVIRDFASGALVPVGSEGEICVRSPSVLSRYWNAPEATAEALRDGWLHTGDIGYLDEPGFLHYLGRNKEMLKVNGMSVFPSEIEALLSQCPAVASSAVVGVQDERRGERPLAFVQLADPAVDGEQLEQWCRDNMASYKVPLLTIVESMPLTATGKIKKNVLIARQNEV